MLTTFELLVESPAHKKNEILNAGNPLWSSYVAAMKADADAYDAAIAKGLPFRRPTSYVAGPYRTNRKMIRREAE